MFWVFLACAAIRFLGLFPFVIDDDEAWWSVSARWLEHPFRFYQTVPDDKTPGSVWFGWVASHLFPALGPDPRWIRAAYYFLTIAAALVLGLIAEKLNRSDDPQEPPKSSRLTTGNFAFWTAASLFLIATILPSPKLLAWTSDGLMVVLTIFAFGLALLSSSVFAMLGSGALLALALLVKQTAIFALIPLIFSRYPKRFRTPELALLSGGFLAVLVPSVLALGPHEMFFWTFSYPMKILSSARERDFSAFFEFASHLMIFSVSLVPLVIPAFFFKTRARRGSVADFRVQWLLCSILVVAIGKGLFLHYYLMAVPPLVLLAMPKLLRTGVALWQRVWLFLGYLACAIAVTSPALEVTWGSDLSYFSALSSQIGASIRPDDTVLLWSGSPMLLAYLRARPASRFIVPRFAIEPYGTAQTQATFYQEIKDHAPSVIIDLHERGDNRFAAPIESDPVLSVLIQTYHLYVPPGVPWAKLYFRSPPALSSGLVEIDSVEMKKEVYSPYPSETPAWRALEKSFRTFPETSLARKIRSVDSALRTRHAIELIARQGANASTRHDAKSLLKEMESETAHAFAPSGALSAKLSEFFGKTGAREQALPLNSREWWFTVSMVQMQPRGASVPPGSQPAITP